MTDLYTYSGWLIFIKKVDAEVYFEKLSLEDKRKLSEEYEKYCQEFVSSKESTESGKVTTK
jgi:hypothetical protein